VIVSDLKYEQTQHHPNGPVDQESPDEGSAFRLAAYFFVVGGTALMIATFTSSRLNPGDEVVKIGILGLTAVGFSVAGGYYGDRVLQYVRRTERRIRHHNT
jgi:hypothetical protein